VYTLDKKRLPLDLVNLDTEREKGKDVDLTYWTGVQEYSPDSAKITCGYCLNTDLCQEPSQKVAIKGARDMLLVGPCCKGIQSILQSGPVNADAAEQAESACAEPAAGAGGHTRKTSVPLHSTVCSVAPATSVPSEANDSGNLNGDASNGGIGGAAGGE